MGAIIIYRQEVRPFTDKQIALVQNFAAQAVIAIENSRLLNELRHRTDDLSEALEQQTATSEVLKIISSSPGELEPAFHTVLENAVKLCEAKFGTLFLFNGTCFRVGANFNVPAPLADYQVKTGGFVPPPGLPLARLVETKKVAHMLDDPERLQSGDQTRRCADPHCRTNAQGRQDCRCYLHLPSRGEAICRKADRTGAELRRASCHRHREHAAAQ